MGASTAARMTAPVTDGSYGWYCADAVQIQTIVARIIANSARWLLVVCVCVCMYVCVGMSKGVKRQDASDLEGRRCGLSWLQVLVFSPPEHLYLK